MLFDKVKYNFEPNIKSIANRKSLKQWLELVMPLSHLHVYLTSIRNESVTCTGNPLLIHFSFCALHSHSFHVRSLVRFCPQFRVAYCIKSSDG